VEKEWLYIKVSDLEKNMPTLEVDVHCKPLSGIGVLDVIKDKLLKEMASKEV